MYRSKRKRGLAKGLTALSLAATASLFSAAGAQAQDIIISGNAQGCFGGGCVPAEAAATVLSGVPVSYNSALSDFNGITADGQLAIQGATGNFGTISIGTHVPNVNISTPFTLLLSFINPMTPDQTFSAVISGVVSILASGSVTVSYSGPFGFGTAGPQPFFDPISGFSGMLSTTAFPTPVPSGSTVPLTGIITANAVVPEPATMALLGTGLTGLIGAARRRRKRQEEELA